MFKFPFFGKNADQSTPERSNIKLLLALGNPGEKYDNTYHNVGFQYLNSLTQNKFKQYQDFAFTKDSNLVLVKSLTYMNQSGKALKQALKYFNLKPEEVLVIHDDSDLSVGEYKMVFDRGSAGHKGVDSIISHLKTKRFFRLRIGIRSEKGKAGEFVLKKISKGDSAKLEQLFSKIQIFNSNG